MGNTPPAPSPEEQEKKDCTIYPCPPVKNISHPLRYYEFTQEEIKALDECDKESFYQRCVPISTLFAALTYTAIKFGILSRNPHFGVIPKLAFAWLLGHVFGRLSYKEVCAEKLREDLSDNSHLGKTMRKYWEEAHPPPDPKKKK